MKIKEIHEILQRLKNGKVTQNDIARAINTSRANVSKLFARNSYINEEKIKMIEEYFEVKLKNLGNYIMVDYYPDTLLLLNNSEISTKVVKCKIPTTFFEPSPDASRFIMCHAQGNAMYPLIWDGDIVIIEETPNQFINDKIYAFIYDKNFYINRLTKNINQYIVQSENKNYPMQYIEKEDTKKLQILGRVVYVGKTTSLL